MPVHTSLDAIWALLSVVAINVALSGDNAIVVGMAAAGLPIHQRRNAIFIGILAAALLRVVFAVFTVQLLDVIGLLFAGGILLLWVCWKLWRELRDGANLVEEEEEAERVLEDKPDTVLVQDKTLREAVTQIIVADVSMSLDNVLAVAGAARDHEWILIVGLGLSVLLVGLAATIIAQLLHQFRWLGYLGLAIIFYVALKMIYDGGGDVLHAAHKGGFF
jgi:YjbE family integral membrane protein